MKSPNPKINAKGLLSIAAISALIFVGCSSGEESEASSGDGVPYGASMEEYQAALADMDPITITTQSPDAPGGTVSSFLEAYTDSVTEWSDGKIEFDMEYANAIAGPLEVNDAIGDGLIDLSIAAPSYQPEKLPYAGATIDLTFEGIQSPAAGTMQRLAAVSEMSSITPEITEELEALNIYPLVPIYTLGLDSLICTEPRNSVDDFEGAMTRTAAPIHTKQLSGLGMNPTSLDFAEVYEGLQRGVIDCSVTSPLTAVLSGMIELAPHITLDEEAGIASAGGGSLLLNKDLWDSLELPAQQLLYDRLDVFLQEELKGTFDNLATMLEQAETNGGGVLPMEQDARDKLQEINEQALAEMRTNTEALEDPEAFVDAMLESTEKWGTIITDDIGVDPEMEHEDFISWYESLDDEFFEQYTQTIFEEAYNKRRPE